MYIKKNPLLNMKLRYFLTVALILQTISFAFAQQEQKDHTFHKLFTIFSGYDTSHIKVEEDTIIFSISEIEEIKIIGEKKILLAKSRDKKKKLPPILIKQKYNNFVKSLGGEKIRDFSQTACLYEIVVKDTQNLFFLEIYNSGQDYSLTLINTGVYKLNPKKLYEEIGDQGHAALHINFPVNQAHVPEEANYVIEGIIDFMNRWKNIKLSIEGHTDNIGEPEKNKQLSLDRANAVMIFLLTHGISSNRLSAKGWGEEKPIADNTTPEGQSKNRRVELVRIIEK